MAEYLSGGRIQGSSAPLGAINKTGLKFYYKFDDSGAATRGKIAGGSQGGYANWGRTAGTVNNGRDNLSYDLGTTLDDEEWIMRFKLHIEKFDLNDASGCQVAFGMSDTDADTAYETNQDSISFRIQFSSDTSQQNFVANNSNGAEMGSNSVVILDWSSSGTINGKDYWVEIKRTGDTTGTVSIGEKNDFSAPRTSVNLSSLSSSTTGLRYFVSKVYDGQSNYVDNHINGDISEVKIYDNQSSPTTVTYDIEDFMKSTSGWNINKPSIQNIIPQTKDCINSASAVGSSDAVANSTIDLEYKAEGVRGATGKLGSAMSIVAGDAKGQASGTNRTDTAFISNTGAVFTMCLWVKVDSRSGDQAWLSTTGLGSGEHGLFFRMQNSSGHIYLKFGTGGGTVIGGTATTQVIPDTNWNFVVGQYDYNDGAIKVSVNNGAFETVATAVISDTTTPYRQLIVGNSPELDNDLNGDMDELSIWNRILTADEITAIYNSGTGEVLNTVQAAGDSEKDSITNVPIGTRYEETDTRKIFRRKVGGLAQVRNVFNTSNYTYTTSGQSGAVTVTNGDDPSGSVRINLGTGSTSPTYAIATFPDSFTTEDKTFQIDFDYTRASSTSGDNVSFLLTSRTWSDNAPPSGEKDMHFQVVNGGSSGATPSMRFKMHTATEQDGTDTNNDFTQGLGTTHHYRVTGDGTNWKFEKWTNANGDYTGSPDVDQTGLDFPSDWASTNPISKIQFGWQGYWYIDYTIKNVTAKFGTGTADTWVEKGTA